MPLIKKHQKTPTEQLNVAIEKPVADELTLYVKFIESAKPYVVQELLREAMKRDKDFQAHKEKRGTLAEVFRQEDEKKAKKNASAA